MDPPVLTEGYNDELFQMTPAPRAGMQGPESCVRRAYLSCFRNHLSHDILLAWRSGPPWQLIKAGKVTVANGGVTRERALEPRTETDRKRLQFQERAVHTLTLQPLFPRSLFCRITLKNFRNLRAGLRIDAQNNVHCEPARGLLRKVFFTHKSAGGHFK